MENDETKIDIKISTIMPVYNASKFLKQSIESVLNQTLKEIELICVDDGSTDNSVEIIKKYAENDSRITLVTQENQTAGAARNNGLKYAHGEYIHYFDADDWMKLNSYETLWNKVKNTDIDVCIFQYSKYDQETKKFKFIPLRMIKEDQKTSFDENPKFFIYNSVVPWNKIIKKQLIIDNNLKYDELVCRNDRSFYYKLMLVSKKIIIIEDALLFYRTNNSSSLVGTTSSKNFDCHFKAFYSYFPCYKDKSIEIQRMIVDVSIKDFLNFYNKAEEKYKLSLFIQIYEFFKNFDMSIMGNLKPYSWNPIYQKIISCNFAILDFDDLSIIKNKTKNTQENEYKYLYLSTKKELENVRRSKSLKIGRFITSPIRFVKKVRRVLKNNGFKGTILKIKSLIKLKYNDKKNKRLLKKSTNKIQNLKKGKEPLIVSLTSYPARIKTLHLVVDSILNQTLKADKIILWLAESQFINKEKDLPKELIAQTQKGLEIHWCEDIKSYKKLIPTLKLFPNATIVTIDDDNLYDREWLKLLFLSHLKDPKCIICHRATKFILDKENKFEIVSGGKYYYHEPCYLNKLVGAGGVLYPPYSLYKDITDIDKFMKLAPTNDDQWFWFMGILNNTKVKVVETPIYKLNYVPNTQETALSNINDHGEKLFWKDFYSLLNFYPQVERLLKKEYYKYTSFKLSKEDFPLEYDVLKTFKKENEYLYNSLITDDEYKEDLCDWYKRIVGEELNLKSPRTFNEKIQWLKVYDSTLIKTQLTDKYLVRDWVRKMIGKEYLIPILGVYDKFDDINFNKLPMKFVMKANHASGWNIIVLDKNKFDKQDAKQKFDVWMNKKFAFCWGLEFHYKNIKPKIVIERYIEEFTEELNDYRFFCFNGKPKFVWCDTYSGTPKHIRTIFDLDWKKQDMKVNYPQHQVVPKKPRNFDKMINLVKKLCKDFIFVRVDLYNINGKIYFGEMTFTPQSGTGKWSNLKDNLYYGSCIKLPFEKK